jgi:activator of Hsp90 ATPase-like protein
MTSTSPGGNRIHLGGEFRARLFASRWEGTGRVVACEPPQRLLLLTQGAERAGEGVIEVTLAADGDHTTLVWEERGMPLDLIAAYGAGIQVHVEDLSAHLGGGERIDAEARWNELHPAYEALAANVRAD